MKPEENLAMSGVFTIVAVLFIVCAGLNAGLIIPVAALIGLVMAIKCVCDI